MFRVMVGRLALIISGKSSIGEIMSCIAGVVIGFFAPVGLLVMMSFEFILVDFVIGVWASHARAKKSGTLDAWGFESQKAWKTIWKFVFVIIGIVLAYHLDELVLTFVSLHLAQLFCGFVCGVELWSFLENAACISDHPVFRWLKKFMGDKVKEVGILPEHIKSAAERKDPMD